MLFSEPRYTIEERELTPDKDATRLSVKIARSPFSFWTLQPGRPQCHVYSIMGLGEVGIFQAARGPASLTLSIVRFPEDAKDQAAFCRLLLKHAQSYAQTPLSTDSPMILRGIVGPELLAIKAAYSELALPPEGLSIRSMVSPLDLKEESPSPPLSTASARVGG